MNWAEFKKVAASVAAQEGYPLSVLLGQAAQETGFGTSPRSQRNQWFGVGVYNDNSPGAQYKSAEDSIRGYINLIKTNPLYARAWASRDNPTQMVREIANAGYAEDPSYFNKVTSNKEFLQNNSTPPPSLTTANPVNITTEQLRQNALKAEQMKMQQMNQTPIANTPEYKAAFNQKPATIMDVIHHLLSEGTPKAYASEKSPQVSPNQYTVRPGDTLFGIAQQRLGDGNRWGELQGYHGDPTQLPVGQTITMPTTTPQPSSTVVPKAPLHIMTGQPHPTLGGMA